MFNKTLIIDNDLLFAESVENSLKNNLDTEIEVIFDLESNIDDLLEYDLYIVRLDTKTDRIIKKLSDEDKLVIITTVEDTQETRTKILSYNITDYVTTISRTSAQFVSKIAKRLESNASKTVITVDDSSLFLMQTSLLLDTQNLNHIQFSSGEEAWKYLSNPDSKKVDLVVTDYEMPGMNGYELVKNIRMHYSFEELPVLVLSGSEDTYMISRFLKVGANDYITKPFINEEFLGRVANSLLLLEMFNQVKKMAMTDYLTGVHNRVYFYETGVKVLDIAKRSKQPVSISMIDIDNFKSVNDTYGHEIGDKALIHVANTIKDSLRESDIFVRFGGEEFVIMLPNCPPEQSLKIMNKVCKAIEDNSLKVSANKNITITVSIGLNSKIDHIDNMIEVADKYMYEAKNSGKNRVYTKD